MALYELQDRYSESTRTGTECEVNFLRGLLIISNTDREAARQIEGKLTEMAGRAEGRREMERSQLPLCLTQHIQCCTIRYRRWLRCW